jgi:hypothetical protein
MSRTDDTVMDLPVFLIPHSHEKFRTADYLKRWLYGRLHTESFGKYQVARAKSWEAIPAGSICVFHKQKLLVGDAVLSQGLKREDSSEVSPDTGRPYEGWVKFNLGSVRTLDLPIPFQEAQVAAGRGLTWRSIQRLKRDEYARILALRGLSLPNTG